jgi:hypothetical protein
MLAVTSCRKNHSPSSSTKFAPIDPKADNYALLFGAPNDLPGVTTDIVEIENLLNNTGYGYRVISNSSATKSAILETLRTYGAKISDRGTLLLYFSGHGTPSGQFVAQGAEPITKKDVDNRLKDKSIQSVLLRPTEVLEALRDGRSKGGQTTPLKFLITIVDTCFSGQWIKPENQLGNLQLYTGTSTGIDSKASNEPTVSPKTDLRAVLDSATVEQNDAMRAAVTMNYKISGNRFIANFLTVTSASAAEIALDAGSKFGGRFTHKLRKIYEDAKNSGSPMTFQQWFDRTYLKVLPNQHIKYFASSKAVLSIDLFSSDRPMVNEDMTPSVVNPFDFTVSSYNEGLKAKFKVTNIRGCSASSIAWSIKLTSKESCSAAGEPCNFSTGTSDFSRDFPEPRGNFSLTGICGSGAPVTYQVILSVAAGDEDRDGIPNSLDNCPGTPTGISVDKTGKSAGCSKKQIAELEAWDKEYPPISSVISCSGDDYNKIKQGGSGICRNPSSGFCYKYSGGDVQYNLGNVACPEPASESF